MDRSVPEAPSLPMAGFGVEANSRHDASGQFGSNNSLGDLSTSDVSRGYANLPDVEGSAQPEKVEGSMIRL